MRELPPRRPRRRSVVADRRSRCPDPDARRAAGRHRYKWTGSDVDLPASIRATINRLGGTGLGKEATAELAVYLESLPAVRTPTLDRSAVARGERVFEARVAAPAVTPDQHSPISYRTG